MKMLLFHTRALSAFMYFELKQLGEPIDFANFRQLLAKLIYFSQNIMNSPAVIKLHTKQFIFCEPSSFCRKNHFPFANFPDPPRHVPAHTPSPNYNSSRIFLLKQFPHAIHPLAHLYFSLQNNPDKRSSRRS